MTERLWEVPYLALSLDVILLRQQAQIVPQGDESVEQAARLFDPAVER
jgi:hypothetical protein